MPTLIKKPEVLKKTSISNATLYRLIAAGKFPRPVPLPGLRAVAWDLDAVDAWINQCIERAEQGGEENA